MNFVEENLLIAAFHFKQYKKIKLNFLTIFKSRTL